MEFRVLEYFLAVAREQSISGAAEFLHLSQPTLSRQLKDMEDELGKQLFIRGNRHITLTEEGMLLRKRAEEIVDLVHKTEDDIKFSDEVISGSVYIGAGETDAVRLIAKAAQKLQKEYPLIRYHIFSGDAPDVAERLIKGLLDFGILFDPIDLSKFEHMKMPMKDTWGVLMRKDSPLAEKESVTPQDLWDKPLIVSRQQEETSALSKWMIKPFAKLNVAASYNLVYNASLMVDEGMGYALCLDKLINVSGNSNLCFRPLYPKLEAEMNFVWKRYQVLSKAAEKFLEYFSEELKQFHQ
ncbi:MAG: LysR family transcriptional regulator [Ruminococcus flavefaciens]|nr:LysR family transcriptional regulator [Ruminococcus flavefaciens]MCM1060963.1 LysR family transcriptional regulator [Eubacterium sp.]